MQTEETSTYMQHFKEIRRSETVKYTFNQCNTVSHRAKTSQLQDGHHVWEMEAKTDKEMCKPNSLVVEIPPFRNQRITSPVQVNFYVCNGKRKRSQYQLFTYLPANVPIIKTEPTDDYEPAQTCGPMNQGLSPLSKPYYSQQIMMPPDPGSCLVAGFASCQQRNAVMSPSPNASPKLHDLSSSPYKCIPNPGHGHLGLQQPTGGVPTIQEVPRSIVVHPSSPEQSSHIMLQPQLCYLEFIMTMCQKAQHIWDPKMPKFSEVWSLSCLLTPGNGPSSTPVIYAIGLAAESVYLCVLIAALLASFYRFPISGACYPLAAGVPRSAAGPRCAQGPWRPPPAAATASAAAESLLRELRDSEITSRQSDLQKDIKADNEGNREQRMSCPTHLLAISHRDLHQQPPSCCFVLVLQLKEAPGVQLWTPPEPFPCNSLEH
ncbi:Nuclear factor of activated T-cells, cytoplasmic 1 isoform X2 [Aix galericulata]|nr:Nuclear factor of activated T-cells, cytoplasmic 1 isoform X2 [Aix galericulata]